MSRTQTAFNIFSCKIWEDHPGSQLVLGLDKCGESLGLSTPPDYSPLISLAEPGQTRSAAELAGGAWVLLHSLPSLDLRPSPIGEMFSGALAAPGHLLGFCSRGSLREVMQTGWVTRHGWFPGNDSTLKKQVGAANCSWSDRPVVPMQVGSGKSCVEGQEHPAFGSSSDC